MDTLEKMSKLKHAIDTRDFTPEIVQSIFYKALNIKKGFDTPTGRIIFKQKLTNKILFKAFDEPCLLDYATDSAAYHMGMQSIGADTDVTIKELAQLHPDVIVFKNYEQQDNLAETTTPLISAGCSGQNPLQALIDAYTIHSRFNKLNDLVILLNDIDHQQIRSLFYLFAKFKGTQFIFTTNSLLPDIRQYIKEHETAFAEIPSEDITKAVHVADVVFGVEEDISGLMKPYSALLSSPPSNDIRNAYYEQIENSMFLQMGLLEYLLKDF
jgi:aspartate carbamoyltransferase catalytic subunit